jgi:DNA-binding GntR family transcriptional regulator
VAQSNGLSSLLGGDALKFERSLLSDRAIELLHRKIITGQLPPGTRLVEREIADLLGISRAPVRDALMQLEKEGLVVTKSDARYVVELTERDVRELYQIRHVLEQLAVELAARNSCPENRQALDISLGKMKEAVAKHNSLLYSETDVQMHRLIWQQADNPHLLNVLNTMVGPIFMFVANNVSRYMWEETYAWHRDLVTAINSGDAPSAVEGMKRHLDFAEQRSLHIVRELNGELRD